VSFSINKKKTIDGSSTNLFFAKKKGERKMKTKGLIVFILIVIPIILSAISVQKKSDNVYIIERNFSVDIDKLENGEIKLSWDEVSEAVAYKIYSAPSPDLEDFSFIIELDTTDLSYQFLPGSEREFYYLTYIEEVSGGTVTDIDGNVYQTLVIGEQEWMVENLKVTHYRNGDPIPNVIDNSTWAGLSTGAYCFYDNSTANGDTYGALYNWFAVDDSRGLAPEGWRVSSDNDIKQLEMYLGMSENEVNSTGGRGTNEGSMLGGGYDLWSNGDLRNNSEFDTSGFSFFPGGSRSHDDGTFNFLSSRGYLWSSTEYSSNFAMFRYLSNSHTYVYRNYFNNKRGFSVRCVRDLN
jgi:uncharacterized protein (TIGR02145 family)